jgi:hypothetical protein
MPFWFALSLSLLAMTPLPVTTGLDPMVDTDASAAWIAESSPAMTNLRA